MKPRKVVSKSQFRFFRDALRRIEAGGESLVKDMTADDLRYALQGVDYNALPERAGQAVRAPRRQPASLPIPARPDPLPVLPVERLEALPDGTLSFDVYRALHPENVSAPVEDGEPGRVLSFDDYVQRHPEKKKRCLPSKVGYEWFGGLFR